MEPLRLKVPPGDAHRQQLRARHLAKSGGLRGAVTTGARPSSGRAGGGIEKGVRWRGCTEIEGERCMKLAEVLAMPVACWWQSSPAVKLTGVAIFG